MPVFAQQLKRLRRNKGVSIKELAPALGVDYTYLSKIENGRAMPSEQVILRIGRYFVVDADELLLAADRIPQDIRQILRENPREALEYLRDHFSHGPGR